MQGRAVLGQGRAGQVQGTTGRARHGASAGHDSEGQSRAGHGRC